MNIVYGQGWTGNKIRPGQFSPGLAHHRNVRGGCAIVDGGGGCVTVNVF